MNEPVLSVRDLTVTSAGGDVGLVTGVSLDLAPGDRLGIIGESGSGKTLTALAIMGLLPGGLRAHGGVRLNGVDFLALPERRRGELRGEAISMVFQEPLTALNPTMRIGRQVAEAVREHRDVSRSAAAVRAIDLLRRVEIPDPERRARDYPHQLSGGQRQRVMLAMAIACDPAVILADEPTTALDVTVQAGVLKLLADLAGRSGSALVLISHDLAVISGMCDRIAVMYGGRVVETGATGAVLSAPRHPYTAGLIATSAAVTLDSDRTRDTVPFIPGQVPGAGEFGTGCPFRSRCDRARDACAAVPPLERAAGPDAGRPDAGHEVACFRPLDISGQEPAR